MRAQPVSLGLFMCTASQAITRGPRKWNTDVWRRGNNSFFHFIYLLFFCLSHKICQRWNSGRRKQQQQVKWPARQPLPDVFVFDRQRELWLYASIFYLALSLFLQLLTRSPDIWSWWALGTVCLVGIYLVFGDQNWLEINVTWSLEADRHRRGESFLLKWWKH